MKKVLITMAVLVTLTFGLAGVAKADTCPSGSTNCLDFGGVTWTFTNVGGDGSGGFLVQLTLGTTGSSSGSLSDFSLQFGYGPTLSGNTDVTNVTMFSTSVSGWTVVGPGNANHCGTGNTPFWCSSGPAITVPDGTNTFVFDVTGLTGGAPTAVDAQAFQGQGDLAISNATGVGGGTSTPEPASMLLLGLGLVGVPFMRRKRS